MVNKDYYYIIIKAPYDNLSQKTSRVPKISKMEKSKFPIMFNFGGKNEEGPFATLIELKRKSLILAGITKQKDRQRILKPKNIQEVTDFFLMEKGTAIAKTYFDSFTHITIGKFTKQKVKGVHFFNPDKVRIIKVIQKDNTTGVYSAKIEICNPNTDLWVEKDEVTTFFPDDWTVSQTFIECYIAYKSRKKKSNKTYLSETQSGIPVKFIIDDKDKILTFYPILETP